MQVINRDLKPPHSIKRLSLQTAEPDAFNILALTRSPGETPEYRVK